MRTPATRAILVAVVAAMLPIAGCKKGDDKAAGEFQPIRLTPPISSIPDPAAKVNGQPVSGKSLEAAISAALRDARNRGRQLTPAEVGQLPRVLLSNLIVKELTYQEGVREGLKPSEEAVAVEVENIKAKFESPEQFRETLDRHGVDADGFVDIVRRDLVSKEVIEAHVPTVLEVADEEAQTVYDENREQFQAPERARLLQIVLAVPEDADDATAEQAKERLVAAKARLESGEEFGKVAGEVSEDPGTAARGGDAGYLARGKLQAPIEEAVFSLPLGQLSEPIRFSRGWALVKVIDRRPEGIIPYEEVKEQVKINLRRQRQGEELQKYINTLRDQAEIEVFLP